jgi:hypothetical protein
LRAIFASSKPKSKNVVLVEIESFIQRADLPASFLRLAQWMKSMVVQKKQGAKKLRNSSISSYLVRVDMRIAVILEDRDPAFFDEDALEDFYSEILGGLTEQSIGRVIIGLRKFHEFLVTEFGAPTEVGDIFDGYANGSSMDANVLALSDYRLAFEILNSSHTGQPLWLAKMQQVTLLLGFRALLRRGEVHRLRMGDLLSNRCGLIYVRSTEAGVVKSKSAIRNIFFEGNLPLDEAAVLREFVNARLRQITGTRPEECLANPSQGAIEKIWETPLFQEPGTSEVIPLAALFNQISRVLHEATHGKFVLPEMIKRRPAG